MQSVHKFAKKDYYSFKFKKTGIRTQFMMDVNEMFINISKSEPAAKCNDGSMFVKWRPDLLMTKRDHMMLDGGYALYIAPLLQANEVDGEVILNTTNFSAPLRKFPNVDLHISEAKYNKLYSGSRSKIETGFAHLFSKFKKFSPLKRKRFAAVAEANLQLKLVCFLWNCFKAEQLFNIAILPHHRQWLNDNFDFAVVKEWLDKPVTVRVEEEMNSLNQISDAQNDYLTELAAKFAVPLDPVEGGSDDEFGASDEEFGGGMMNMLNNDSRVEEEDASNEQVSQATTSVTPQKTWREASLGISPRTPVPQAQPVVQALLPVPQQPQVAPVQAIAKKKTGKKPKKAMTPRQIARLTSTPIRVIKHIVERQRSPGKRALKPNSKYMEE